MLLSKTLDASGHLQTLTAYPRMMGAVRKLVPNLDKHNKHAILPALPSSRAVATADRGSQSLEDVSTDRTRLSSRNSFHGIRSNPGPSTANPNH